MYSLCVLLSLLSVLGDEGVTVRYQRLPGHVVSQGNFLRAGTAIWEAVKEKDGALENFVAFIDDIKIKKFRPGIKDTNQRANYLGHKRLHGLTYQTVTDPVGLINIYMDL